MTIVDKIMQYEADGMSAAEELFFFAELIESGMCWQLQGHYGRTAHYYITNGLISKKGKIQEKVFLALEGLVEC